MHSNEWAIRQTRQLTLVSTGYKIFSCWKTTIHLSLSMHYSVLNTWQHLIIWLQLQTSSVVQTPKYDWYQQLQALALNDNTMVYVLAVACLEMIDCLVSLYNPTNTHAFFFIMLAYQQEVCVYSHHFQTHSGNDSYGCTWLLHN